jgi:hypothetical protein
VSALVALLQAVDFHGAAEELRDIDQAPLVIDAKIRGILQPFGHQCHGLAVRGNRIDLVPMAIGNQEGSIAEDFNAIDSGELWGQSKRLWYRSGNYCPVCRAVLRDSPGFPRWYRTLVSRLLLGGFLPVGSSS